MDLGRVHPHRTEDPFMMTVLALKMSRKSNGVSELHGHTSRDMWKELYGKENPNDVPIHYVTNGIHTPSWANQTAHLFWNKRLGADWTEKLMKPEYWMRLEIDHIASDAELWALRYSLRRNLVEYVRKQLHEQHLREGTDGHYDHVLSPDALTICFARRFATYKRAPLIFRNLEQTLSIFTNPDYPVQIIFAGKAHPRDNEGKRFLQQIIEMTHHHQLFGKVAFIENYDINVARYLISGADVWLNTPLRPLEASGTSGMKILIHGGLNFSIMDGWWREGYDGKNGWKIGNDSHSDPASQDEQDFNDMLRMLRDEIIPEFYTRDSHGIPTAWIKRIRHSMRTLIPRFNTDRMVEEYVTDYYLKTK
jgi:starch phosphorylase